MTPKQVTAIDSKYQSLVNRFLKADSKYDKIVNETDNEGGLKQEMAYEVAYELYHQLPKREQENLQVEGY